MAEIRPIDVATMRALGGGLLQQHYDEVAKHKDLLVLQPDWPVYEQLEAAGKLLALGAWDGTELVGYSANIVSPMLHYAGVVACQNDVMFVAADRRAAKVFRALREATKAEAARRGAKLMLWHAKESSALDTILRRSCSVQDIIYSERL